MNAEAFIEWNKWLCAQNEYKEDFHVKRMKKYGHGVEEEEDGSSEDE